VGDPASEATQALLREVNRVWRPNAILALAPAAVDGESVVPLLSHRTLRGGQPTAYVCKHFVCANPVTEVEALRGLLVQ